MKVIPRRGIAFTPTTKGGLLVDVDSGECFAVNPVGAEVWAHIQNGKSIEEIRALLESQYGISPDLAVADLQRLLDSLLVANLVIDKTNQRDR